MWLSSCHPLSCSFPLSVLPCGLVALRSGCLAVWLPCGLVALRSGCLAVWLPCGLVALRSGCLAVWLPCGLGLPSCRLNQCVSVTGCWQDTLSSPSASSPAIATVTAQSKTPCDDK